MRWSKYYIPTLKEAPSDAEVVSHKLMVRAGMIRKLTSGIYSWLPLGLRSLEKAKSVVRQCMNEAGALEVFLPTVQPADLWIESGRWTRYGKELLRFKDRHERDYCLGPTHEEVITDLLRGEVRSYRQLPLNLYQIQTKFRDEIRPRFGLMRGREFLMKDAYSFDVDDAHADVSYAGMRQAYINVFKALGLDFRIVDADSGAIGGSFSHEFMVLASTGEDDISSCTAWPTCEWAANVEKAPLKDPGEVKNAPCAELELVSTPGQHTVQEVCDFMRVSPANLVKTLLLKADGQPVAVLLRGDRELNEVKLKNLLDAQNLEFATPDEVLDWSRAPAGFAGPVKLGQVDKIYADFELKTGNDWVCGANKADAHYRHLDLARDLDKTVVWVDLRKAVAGDPCPACGAPLEIKRGIEVGHIFKLGTKYSEAMNARFLDEDGSEKDMIMGCYGIGVSRVIAACIEQNFDDNGIMFPPPLAPFDLQIINLDPRNEAVTAKAEAIDAFFSAKGLETLYDDREERPGVKFKDADLLGLPLQVVLGGKGLERGIIEVKNRKTGHKAELPAQDFESGLWDYYQAVLSSWNLGELGD